VEPVRRPDPYPVGVGKDPRTPLQVEQAPRNINYSEVSWDLIMAILRQAERGATERWADLSRRMLTDGHLASNVETRKLAIATAKLSIEPSDPDDPIDVRGAADAQRMLDELPTSRIKRDAADGIFVGWACLQIMWETRGAWLWPGAVEWNHPRRFRFGYDFKPYIYDDGRAVADQHKLTPDQRAECQRLNVLGMPLDPYRWIVHMPRAFPDFPQMGGVLLSAVRPWWIKANALRYNLDGAEGAGNGLTIGTQDPAADEGTKDAFLTNLSNLGASGKIVVSPGAKVERIAPLAQGASSVWSALIESSNGDMSKAVLGSTLAVDVGASGSRALGETQKAVTIDPRAEVDDDEIRHTLHRDLVDVFLELNRWAYGGKKPNVRTRSIWVEDDAPQVDELLVKCGVITNNQLLVSRGLPPLETPFGSEFATLPDAMPSFGAPMPGDAATLPTAADGSKVEAVADTALNGAQVTSLGGVLANVATGALSSEAAVLFLVSSFPSIPEERARRMVEAQLALVPPAAPVEAPAAALAAPPEIMAGSQWKDTVDGHTLTVTAVHGGNVYFTDADYVDPRQGPQPERQHSFREATFRERCSPVMPAPGGAPAASPLSDGPGDSGDPVDRSLASEAHGDLWALSDTDREAALTGVGHPGLLTAQAMLDGVPLFERLRASLIEACGKATSTATLAGVLKTWSKRKSAPLSDQLYEVNLHARMAGMLFVAQYEVPEVFAKPAKVPLMRRVRLTDDEEAADRRRMEEYEEAADRRERDAVERADRAESDARAEALAEAEAESTEDRDARGSMTLWRAAGSETLNPDSTSFAEDREVAEAYLSNPGFGGTTLYRAEVGVPHDAHVLDLFDEDDPTGATAEILDIRNPGAIGADEWIASNSRVQQRLRDAGYQWVVVRESFPAGTRTWIRLGDEDEGRGAPPVLAEAEAAGDDAVERAVERAVDPAGVPFLALPFDEAIAAFEARRVVSPEEFAEMDEAARSESFTATRLAHETLVTRARELLLRTLRDGGTFEDFRTALTTDEAALGVTPSAPWYLETVYRTNVQMSYGAGRLALLTSPAVAAARPYLERRTARDNRVRETHAALEGALFPNGSPLADEYAPPYLDGELQFNCRCVLVARRAEDVDTSKLFTG